VSGRHAFLRFGVIGLIAMTLFGSGRAASVHEASANTSDLSSVALPGDMGQTSLQAFVPQTGHTVRGYLLDYWRANGAASVYGNPISEPYASDDGYYSQAFEGGIFQFLPDLVWTDSPSVELQNVTQSVLNDRAGTFRRDGRRASGGGDRRSYSWRDLNPNSSSVTRAVNNGQIYSEATGQTVTGAFYDWYTSHEGYAYLGNPISQPLEQRGVVVQYFQGAALMRDSTGLSAWFR